MVSVDTLVLLVSALPIATTMQTGFTISAIDHFVLTVRDLRATIAFYTSVLGLQAITFGEGRTALAFGLQKINVHEAGREYEPKAAVPTPGSADLCFITAASPDTVMAHLRAHHVEVVEGPVRRTGARGSLISVYFRDPDGNLLEVSSYE